MPQAHNMATNIGVLSLGEARFVGRESGASSLCPRVFTVGMTGSDTLAKTLQNVSRYVEMNLSNIDSVRAISGHDFRNRESCGLTRHGSP